MRPTLDEADVRWTSALGRGTVVDVGSNYVKHGNFVLVNHNVQRAIKVYRSAAWAEAAAFRFRKAAAISDAEIIVPDVERIWAQDGRHFVELRYVARTAGLMPLETLPSLLRLRARVAVMPVLDIERPLLADYEFRTEFEHLLPCAEQVLCHGDLNFKNVYRSRSRIAVVDWDNLSFRGRRVADAYFALMFLAHPAFEDTTTMAAGIEALGAVLGVDALRDAERLAERKALLSVDPPHIEMWSRLGEAIHAHPL